ncbi:GspH/FimT family pseudopilin [Pseudomonas sp. PDNC002]|uniref:GspH/FimT family pseudopilin n=1 Tax=Pseudomonas sp. PDNC002 TaxID=2811422 RepID=UPI00196444AC|nr:GspH/FimT family pseudopilin [Pseudomonas sp. PDNC002]QRY81437.1 GspH/FimT family pseudopilin [Pseudomonas sp. PDNC002]
MPKDQGLSLIELLLTVAILAITLSLAAPGLSELLRNHRTSSTTHELRNALDFARETSVHTGQPISIAISGVDWSSGWEVFVDSDNRGTRNANTPPLAAHGPLAGVSVRTDSTSRRYIHFTPRGNSIQANGAFHSGSLTLCGEGQVSYRIVFNKAGRIRTESGTTEGFCPH